jgi:hypothetical protein
VKSLAVPHCGLLHPRRALARPAYASVHAVSVPKNPDNAQASCRVSFCTRVTAAHFRAGSAAAAPFAHTRDLLENALHSLNLEGRIYPKR